MTGFRMVYVSAALLASTRMGDLVLFVFISIDVKLFEVFTILLLNRKKKKKKKKKNMFNCIINKKKIHVFNCIN